MKSWSLVLATAGNAAYKRRRWLLFPDSKPAINRPVFVCQVSALRATPVDDFTLAAAIAQVERCGAAPLTRHFNLLPAQ